MQENYLKTFRQKPLISPAELFKAFPIDSTTIKKIQHFRESARRIIAGEDKKLLVIVGPCSIHDVKSALEFAKKLQTIAKNLANELFIIMRVYFEKPRTTIGWKGLISDPYLNNTFDVNHGLMLARKLLIDLSKLDIPAGTEFLDTIIPQYLSDLISWSAIGARTSESQLHRELASGLAMPVGFKNTTDGNVQIAIDAVNTARYSHHFLSINSEGKPIVIQTLGNSDCHIVLRGGNDEPNYSAIHIQHITQLLKNAGLPLRLMVDCSHGNSMKYYQNQMIAAQSVAEQIKQGGSAI